MGGGIKDFGGSRREWITFRKWTGGRGTIGKDSGSKSGVRVRNKDIRVRRRNSFVLSQERLPRDRRLSSSRRFGGSPLLPSRVPSIFPATRTGTNCDSTVATSSSSPPPPLLLLRGKVLLRTLIVAQFSKKIARLPRTAKKKLEQSLSVMAKRF